MAGRLRVDQAIVPILKTNWTTNHNIAMGVTRLEKSWGYAMGFYPKALIRGMDIATDTPYSTQMPDPSDE